MNIIGLYCLNFIFYTFLIGYISAYEIDSWKFPNGFLIGAATSSYQIEGAWNASGKGESVWDRYTHSNLKRIKDGSNGDIACDSYHKYKEDVNLLKQMEMNVYRFSLSWTRILPTGYPNIINEDGIRYYNELLDELETNGIEPVVTIYHWDHPQVFQDFGGWMNEVMVDLFGDYARVVFREFGKRVKLFITINEPPIICSAAWAIGEHGSELLPRKHAEYLCSHNILKAHARAYHIYNDEFRNQQNGKIGIVINTDYFYPKYKGDQLSPEVAFQFSFERFFHPIFSKDGDYPDILKKRIAKNSKFEGLQRSRLPTFSKDWIDYIKGTSDFLGLNHYTSSLVAPAPNSNSTIYENDHGLQISFDEKWPLAYNNWRIVPQGFHDLLRKIKDEYGNPPIYVTENGIADEGIVQDDQRIGYLFDYLKAMLSAINDYGCNVKGYIIWSLLDSFEWTSGYRFKFGLCHVDFNDLNRTRTPKKSVTWLKKVIRERRLQIPDPKYF